MTGRPWVLLIEDDPALAHLIELALSGDGCDVTIVSTGAMAVEAAASGRLPDLVITDVRLPGLDGLALLAGFRAQGWKMPVIVMTAYDVDGVRGEAAHTGATAVFGKPFDIDDLRTAVLNLAPRAGQRSTTVRRMIARLSS